MFRTTIRIALIAVALPTALPAAAQSSNATWDSVCRGCHGSTPQAVNANAAGAPALLNSITRTMFGGTLTTEMLNSVTQYLESFFQTAVVRTQTTNPNPVTIEVGTDVVLGGTFARLTELVVVTPPASGSVAISGTRITYTPAAPGTYWFTYRGRNAGDTVSTSPRTVIVDVNPLSAERNYQGLYWRSPAGSESGWGVNVTHQGNILFATWFTYNTDGTGLWLVLPAGVKTGNATYSGTLYRTTGPAFNVAQWNPSAVNVIEVGTATFTFHDADNGAFITTVDGLTQSKPITRQVYSSPVPSCTSGGSPPATPNYQDLWWGSPAGAESGWGVNVTHQGDILFGTWFTYDATGKGQWLVLPSGNRSGATSTYGGTLYRTTGPSYRSTNFNPAQVVATPVGTASFTFSDANNGTFSYTVDGVTGTKPITRQVYSSPTAVCR